MSLILTNVIKNKHVIAVVGTEKNVGKTTTLNWMIEQLRGKCEVALTSVGVDGEPIDIVTNTRKPRIYVEAGTIFATAKGSLKRCDVTKEILDTTNIGTPLGSIVIVRAGSDGYVELAGPSMSRQLLEIKSKIEDFKPKHIFIDGALFRKAFANPKIVDGFVLATGAAVSKNMDEVTQKTFETLEIMNLPILPSDTQRKFLKEIACDGTFNIIGENDIQTFKMPASVPSEAIQAINESTKYLLLTGVVTDKILETLITKVDLERFHLIVPHAMKIVATGSTIKKITAQKGKLFVLDKSEVLFVTANPVAPQGYEFPMERFLNELKKRLGIEVINVLT